MKKIENSFAVTGFVGKDAEIRQFATASVARFSLAVSRSEKNGEETNRTSAFMNIEAWRKNENTASFDRLTKGTMLTVEGYLKPEEWETDGVKRNRIVFVATKFYEPEEKEDTPAPKKEKKTSKKKAK
ncbi:MAG: single-stranded DNA-binding protein [Prevotella sp.]|nr:single-stranded DNA-binding protein [Prevotella sp.]